MHPDASFSITSAKENLRAQEVADMARPEFQKGLCSEDQGLGFSPRGLRDWGMSQKCKCGDGEGVLVLRFSLKLRLSREAVAEKSAHGKEAWFNAYKSILFGKFRENRLHGVSKEGASPAYCWEYHGI